MMVKTSNKQLITDVMTIMAEQVDKNLFHFSNILEERDNIQYLDASKYREVAGLILKLNAVEGEDLSATPELMHEMHKDTYIAERRVILRYLLTHINFELFSERENARKEIIETLEYTVKTFNPEFLYSIYLILLFDGEHEYRYLCRPLADYAVNVLFNEEKGGL